MEFFGLLTIVLITLRLTGVIAWTWLAVLSPLIIGFCLWLVMLFVYINIKSRTRR